VQLPPPAGNPGSADGDSLESGSDPLAMPPAPPLSGSIVPGPPPPDSVSQNPVSRNPVSRNPVSRNSVSQKPASQNPGPLPTREGKQDSNPLGHHGFNDPDEPNEGMRLMR
jgi:hypothetical protein